MWQFVEELVLLKVESDKVLLVGGPFGLLAYFGDGHEFFLVILVHEIQEIFSFGEPLRIQFTFLILLLPVIEEHSFRIGKLGSLRRYPIPDRPIHVPLGRSFQYLKEGQGLLHRHRLSFYFYYET